MMKFYPKQSVCPHCRTVYRYADVRELMWKKDGVLSLPKGICRQKAKPVAFGA